MTSSLEDLVRAAQERQADRAVPIAVLRPALTARLSRARRHRRAGAVAAAAAATAAIAVPAMIWGGGPQTALPPAPVGPAAVSSTGPTAPPAKTDQVAPTGSAAPTGPAATVRLDLGYRLAWVPDGFTERVRSAFAGETGDPFGPTVSRTWMKEVGVGDPGAGKKATIELYVRTAVPDAPAQVDTSGDAVDINGAKGHYYADGTTKSGVTWAPGPTTLLIVAAGHLDLPKNDLLRIARSVRPEAGTVAEPVRLGYLPNAWSTTGILISGPSRRQWRAEVFTSSPGNSLRLTVGDTTDVDVPAGGEKLTVRGRPARHPVRTDEPGRSLTYLVVDLGAGKLMTVVADGIKIDELVRVAEDAVVTGDGTAWLGRG